MSDKHTPGRLHIGKTVASQYTLYDEHGQRVANSFESVMVSQRSDGECEANARRLVACWNACEGLDTETLELMASGNAPSLREIFGEHGQLWGQRDELLAALRGLLDALPSATTHPAIKAARAAIAKVEGT